MSVGQRIAQKRKEMGLSQEGLGEKLGVSRQAIYKWESDSALPEVEKLIALSRLFGVSVGWLLGTEEETAAEELSETQLKMVEEIAGRYLSGSRPKGSRRWLALGAAVCLAVCLVMGKLYQRLEELTRESQQLQWAVSQVETSVNRQIRGISGQMEDILKDRNDLTADCGAEFLSVDLAEGNMTFALRAMPKTYVPGMEAVFLVDCGEGEPLKFPAALGEDGAYRAEATFPLTDSRVLSVVFLSPDGTRANQRMESDGYYLYELSESFPDINVWVDFTWTKLPDPENIRLDEGNRYVSWWAEEGRPFWTAEPARLEEIRIGLFKNGTLVFWAEDLEEKPASFQGDWGDQRFAAFPDDVAFSVTEEDRLTVVAFGKDQYGRVFAQKERTYGMKESAQKEWWLFRTDEAPAAGSWGSEGEMDWDDPLTWDYPKEAQGWPV